MIEANVAGWRQATIAVALVLGLTSACSREPIGREPSSATSESETAAVIEKALTDRNFGLAAENARAAQVAYPHSARMHLLAGMAEARLGNAGSAAAAFTRAVDAGLEDPERALADPAFDTVRGDPAFASVHKRLRPNPPRANRETPPSRDRVRAGDVEILEDESGTYVRAGDIVLDTRP